MATGDVPNMLWRLRKALPSEWFADDAVALPAALSGGATVLSFIYGVIQFAKAQMRLATMSGGWLDLFAYDYFGRFFPRRTLEADDSYRARIAKELLRERVTVNGIRQALCDLTGQVPLIYEPWNAQGGYGARKGIAYGGGLNAPPARTGYGVRRSGYGVAGASYGVPSASQAKKPGVGFYASLSLPYQIFVTAYRPRGNGIPYVAGYGTKAGGYGIRGRLVYSSITQTNGAGAVTDADIYACVAATKAAGIRAWVAIVDVTGAIVTPVIDGSLDFSVTGNPLLDAI